MLTNMITFFIDILTVVFHINYAKSDFKSKQHRAHNDTIDIKL